MDRTAKAMRDYWDDSARRNALWYVDTTMAWDEPDMAKFLAGGHDIVDALVTEAPVGPPAHGLAVEIGSGVGRVCLALSEQYERVIGVDVSPEMVQRARDQVTDSRVTFLVGDGLGLGGVDDACADLVVSFTVFQHIPRASVVHGYLAEAARVLRPGGLLAFQWSNAPWPRLWPARRALLSALQRSGVRREQFGRHAPEFLGCRIPLAPIQRTLAVNEMELAGTTRLGTLFATAWAVKRG